VLLKEKENHYLIDRVLPSSILAGFTKNVISGNLPQDIQELFKSSNPNISLAYLQQVHSAQLRVVENPGVYEGDAIFTNLNNCILAIRTADCLPLFFFSFKLGAIGLVHMGWQPANKGILENIPYNLSSFKAIAGVGLRHCCYEVGEEFLTYPQLKEHLEKRNQKLYFNPVMFAKDKLLKLGLKTENFFDLDICSLCNPQALFSYRRNKTESRTISFIMKIN
jgi:YfiH family protein